MKIINYVLVSVVSLFAIWGCTDLDLTPKTGISSENFFRDIAELEIGLNALYEKELWKIDEDWWTDDMYHRGGPATNDISTANLNSESTLSRTYWDDLYDGIKRANTVLEAIEPLRDSEDPGELARIEGEARAIRAYFYGILVTKFGDVPLLTSNIVLQEAYDIVRTDKEEVKNFIFNELDVATNLLPDANTIRATKGFAQGIKARIALYMEDYETARIASQNVMDLETYELDSDFERLFLREGSGSREHIFYIAQSQEFNVNLSNTLTRDYIPRNAGGFGAALPTFEAMHVFECTDGETIDKSPLYNPRRPFENRDPRLTETIVEFGTPWLGYIYEPHPDSLTTISTATNTRIANNDSRGVAIFASYTGLLWKKNVEQRWADNPRLADPNLIILRYADILLMHAEALIELNQELDKARNLINQVRARAYGVPQGQFDAYPAITETDPTGLRTRLRRERRVELMGEGLRYQDVIRWRIAKKALARILLGLPQPTDQDRNQWPFNDQVLPIIDEDGVVDMNASELIVSNFARTLETYDFDEDRMYIWPIPAIDRFLNSNLTQNPGY